MGTYTANKNLYMPTIGEQGWGDLMNTNLSTIDNFLKPITVSGSTYTFTGNHVGNQSGGSISATSISNSGTLTQTGTSTFTGKITANGGIGTTSLTTSSTITSTGKITGNGGISATTGTFSGAVTGASFNGVVLKSSDVYNVSPSSTMTYSPSSSTIFIVLPVTTLPYTGSLKFTNYSSSDRYVYYYTGTSSTDKYSIYVGANSSTTFSFSNVRYVGVNTGGYSIAISTPIIS